MGRKKRSRDESSGSSSSDSDTSTSSESEDERHRKKRKDKHRKKKKDKHKKRRKKDKKRRKEKRERRERSPSEENRSVGEDAASKAPIGSADSGVNKNGKGKASIESGAVTSTGKGSEEPPPPPKRAAMRPQMFAEFQEERNTVREVYDPETGRMRLVRGKGEIIERIVSREQQRAINKHATRMDGVSFQASMQGKL